MGSAIEVKIDFLKDIQDFLNELETVIEKEYDKEGKEKNEYIINTNDSFIYNEFSLQHELGIYLREKYKEEGYRVEFERNSRKFYKDTKTKHEMDIVIYNETKKLAAIELKFPRNGQYPEMMFSFAKDIRFLEELVLVVDKKGEGFEHGVFLAIVNDKNFYTNTGRKTNSEIYDYFRKGKKDITGSSIIEIDNLLQDAIKKPTGNEQNLEVKLKGKYKIKWKSLEKDEDKELKSPIKYLLIYVNKKSA